MVRPSASVYTYLPEPPGWRAHPPGRLPSDATDPCWSLDPAPPAEGSRPLAIVEVVDYDLFVLGTSRVIELDPVGVLAERLGDEAVQRVRRALRESRTYPSLSDLSDALLLAIFGERGPSGWLFEAIVSPHVYATRTLWDTRLLGRRKQLKTYRGREVELDTSPDLACCNMDVLHPVSRPLSDARRHWTVRICQITPLVRKELTDGEAKAMLQRLLDQERRDPSRLAVGHRRRGHGDQAASKPARLGGDAQPERDRGSGAPPSRDGASGSGPGGREGAGSGGCEGAGSGGGGGGGAVGADPTLLRVLELLERRDALRSRREWAEADRIKEELVALHVRLDDRNKKYSIRPPRGSSSSAPSWGAAPSLGADALRAKPRKKPRTATLQVGRVVFLRPGRLPGGASPHQPHLILEETWPLRGDRGCRTTRHFRLQPQPSGEPFLLEEDAVTALHNGFRDAWLAMEAAGHASQREALLRALSWYCDENAWRPPLDCIRQLLHSGAVSKEQALELAAEMRALTGVGGEAYASDGEEPAGAAAAPPPARNTLGRVPFAAGDVVWLRSELTPRAMLVLGHTAWEGGGARSWLRLKALPTAEGGSNGGSSAAGVLPRLPEPEELTADEAAPVEYVASFDQLRDVGLGPVLPAPGGADEGGAGPVEPEQPLVPPRRNNVELMRKAWEAKGGADAEDCRRQEAAARGDEARMEQPAASAGGEAGCIPHGVVLHSGCAAGSGGSFVTAPTAATVGSAGSGSKRNWVADANSVGSEIARHHRAERRQREAAAPGAVVVPASHRAAVLEGLRRVLGKEGGDPEEWWERNGTGGPFPFEVELAGPL